MSVPTTPDAPAEWSLETAIAESGFMDDFTSLLGGEADTPAAATETPPSETGRETPETATEPKAETPATEDASDAAGEGQEVFTRQQYERSRAKANKQRDDAIQEAARVRGELDQRAKDLAENEFQRGVLLRTDQLLDNLLLQKGHTTLEDKRAAQIQAYNEMRSARDLAVEADLQSVQADTAKQQWTEQQVTAANAEADAIFARNSMVLQREAGAAGVPTFDAETALLDVLHSAEYQQDIGDINSLPDRAQMKAAADRLYARAMREVRTKFGALAEVTRAQAAPPPQAAAPPPQEFTRTTTTGAQGYDIDSALERTFDPDNFFSIIQANPHLRGR